MEHEEYLKRRDELLKIRTKSFDAFDKAILSLATGSLALSVTFLEKIGKPFDLLTITLIFISWTTFFLVIVANLLSYLFAKSNMDRKIAELDDTRRREIESGSPIIEVEKTYWQRKATDICNICAFVLFAVGVATFTYYIVEIQKHNYAELKKVQEQEKKEMTNKNAEGSGKGAPLAQKIIDVCKDLLSENHTEVSRAVGKPVLQAAPLTKQAPASDVIKGQTEAPQAVQRPVVNSQQSTSQDKK